MGKKFQKDVDQKQVGFFLPKAMLDEVEDKALESGLTISSLIKNLLSEWLLQRR